MYFGSYENFLHNITHLFIKIVFENHIFDCALEISKIKDTKFCLKGKVFARDENLLKLQRSYIWRLYVQISTNTSAYWDITYHLLTAVINSSFQTKRT